MSEQNNLSLSQTGDTLKAREEASSEKTSYKRLKELAQSEDKETRRLVTANNKTSVKALTQTMHPVSTRISRRVFTQY